jgi:hypothetical protein
MLSACCLDTLEVFLKLLYVELKSNYHKEIYFTPMNEDKMS